MCPPPAPGLRQHSPPPPHLASGGSSPVGLCGLDYLPALCCWLRSPDLERGSYLFVALPAQSQQQDSACLLGGLRRKLWKDDLICFLYFRVALNLWIH